MKTNIKYISCKGNLPARVADDTSSTANVNRKNVFTMVGLLVETYGVLRPERNEDL